MSNLPHPLGSSVAGELFYPGPPSVTAYDIAGAAGSRAVEFGEDGTSAATNRLGYALGKNEEYIQARMEAPIAAPRYLNWTPSAGSGDKYIFSGVNLFVGDATYLPENQDIRDSLICVLDSNYNEILDATGNRVVIKSLKNSGETSSIVGDQAGAGGDGNGFYSSGAVARFKSVNPVTGSDVLPTVIIPDGTNVILVHGVAGTLDSLATVGSQHLMRDMLVKGTVRSAAHIAAANFLRDGSRTMLANIDMDGHQVTNCQALRGTGAVPMDIANTAGGGDLIRFSDFAVSLVSLANAGCTSPYTPGGFWPSILGVLNSGARLNEKLHGNRTLSKGGALDWQAGYINVPDMVVSLNGEAVDVPAQRFPAVGTVFNGATRLMAVAADGSLVERTALLTTDALLAAYRWSGSWDSKLDARWVYGGTSSTFEITVGSTGYSGADFTSLQEACDFTAAIAPTMGTGRLVIRILGEVELSDTLDLSSYVNYVYLKIKGDNPYTSKIKASATFPVGKHLIQVNGTAAGSELNRVDFEDLGFKWGNTSAHQSNGFCAIFNPGHRTSIRNCVFAWATYGFADIVRYADSGTPIPSGLHLVDCYFSNVRRCIVNARSRGYGIVVENCKAESCSSPEPAFRLTTSDNKVLRTQLLGDGTDHFDYGVQIGPRGEVVGCNFYIVSGAAVSVNHGSATDITVSAHDNYFQVSAGVGLSVVNSAGNGNISFRNNTVKGGAYGVYINNTSGYYGKINIDGNRFEAQTVQTIRANDYGRDISISDNYFIGVLGDVIEMVDNYNVWIQNNTIEGCGGLATNFGIKLGGTGPCGALVGGNYCTFVGSHATSSFVQITGSVRAQVSDNRFLVEGSQVVGFIIDGDSQNLQIMDNYFDGNNKPARFIRLIRGVIGYGLVIKGNTFLNAKTQTVSVVANGYGSTIIEHNIFRDGDNTALELHPNGTASVSGSIVRGNTLVGITGYRGGGSDAVVMSIGGTTLSSGMLVEGNNFQGCGCSADVYGFGILGRGNGLIRDNVFTNFVGYPDDPSTSVATCIGTLTGDTYLIEGNKFFQDVTIPGMPRQMYVINTEETSCAIKANQCTLSGNLAGWTNGVFRFIRSATFNDEVCNNNSLIHWGGSLSGTGTDLLAIEVNGEYCSVCLNRVQNYGMQAYGDYSVVMGNMVIGGNLNASGEHSVVSGNSIPNGTLTTSSSAHPDKDTQYQNSSLYPGIDANHISGD